MNAVRALVLEPCGVACQQREPLGVQLAQAFRGAETVDHDAVAALGRVLEAIEDLQGRHRIAVGVVGVRLQAQPGIGEVGRVDLGADLEIAAIVGFPDETEHRGTVQ